MTDQHTDWDFKLVGSFVNKVFVQLRSEEPGRLEQAGYAENVQKQDVWECRFCYALTNSPEKHYSAAHSDFDAAGYPPLGWVRPDDLRIER